jgi:hypothetical protein
LIHEKVLWGVSSVTSDLRDLHLGRYQGKEALYVADSDPQDSGILIFGECFQSTSLRPFIGKVVSTSTNAAAQHAYGVTVDRNGDIYASFQDTDLVLRFHAESFEPYSPSPDLVSIGVVESHKNSSSGKHSNSSVDSAQTTTFTLLSQHHQRRRLKNHNTTSGSFYNGTFVQFGLPGSSHSSSERGVRDLAWARNYTELWIANEDLDSVVIVDRQGIVLDKLSIGTPIGLYAPPDRPQLMFVGCKNSKVGTVYAIDVKTRSIVTSYQYIGMKHPTGIVSHNDVLFVGDQTSNSVVTFNITTARVIKVIIPTTKIDGAIEQLMLSPC